MQSCFCMICMSVKIFLSFRNEMQSQMILSLPVLGELTNKIIAIQSQSARSRMYFPDIIQRSPTKVEFLYTLVFSQTIHSTTQTLIASIFIQLSLLSGPWQMISIEKIKKKNELNSVKKYMQKILTEWSGFMRYFPSVSSSLFLSSRIKFLNIATACLNQEE